MIVGPSLNTALPIYTPYPVSPIHFLNKGRVAWWLTLPNLYGGRQWFDLMGLNPGTLTNMTSTSGWRGTTRPGGYGHLLFGGSNENINIPSDASFNLGNVFSFCAWAYCAVSTGSGARLPIFSTRNSSTNGWNIEFGGSGTNRVAVVTPGVFNAETADNAIAANSWYRICYTRNGTGVGVQNIYINGVNQSLATDISVAIVAATGECYIGREQRNNVYWNGRLDDVTIFSRPLPATEAKADYDLSRLGYPGVLNRIAPSFSVPTAGAPVYLNLTGNFQVLAGGVRS